MPDDPLPQRVRTHSGRLARLGFADPDGAVGQLQECGIGSETVVERLAQGADPDLALQQLCAIAGGLDKARPAKGAARRERSLEAELEADPELLTRLVAVLGASRALGDFLTVHPEAVFDLRATTMPVEHRDQAAFERVLTDVEDGDALRVAYRRQLLQIAARDLTRRSSYETTAAELADLAGATLATALRLARARAADAESARLAVIAMGKCGGRELNYVSDV